MMYIRQRKETKTIEVSEDFPSPKGNVKLEEKPPSGCASGRFWKILSSVVGGIVALCIGLLTSVYLATLHENDLWFSNIKKYLEPVYFYIYTLFGLQAVYVAALYMTSWLLSGTWLSGLLAALWYVTNSLAWQFNQFMMLLQALVLFILDSLDMLPAVKCLAAGDGVLGVFALDDPSSLDQLQQIWSTWSLHQKQQLPLVLVGNKCDLVMTSGDAHTAAANVAHKWGVPFVKTSAKTQQGVEEAFALIVHEIQRAQEAVAEPSMEKTQPHEATCRCGCSVA
ncbi:GTPase ERas [Cricetulus griseus]|uniref:GTPase ERas n=1 Tax=Cricetulus griseus TaxID=10029 RepID=G3HF23_CRIGR|nr:GTPase ERas [Cricetulus griseus]